MRYVRLNTASLHALLADMPIKTISPLGKIKIVRIKRTAQPPEPELPLTAPTLTEEKNMTEKPENKKPSARLDDASVIILSDFMRTIATTKMIGDRKVCTYAEGWSDRRVFEEFVTTKLPNFTENGVSNFRLRIFGEVETPLSNNGKPTALWHLKQNLVLNRLAAVEDWAQRVGDSLGVPFLLSEDTSDT